jgi:hypothetical protein
MGGGMRKPHLLARTLFILVTALALAVGATFLPDNPYQRFQLLAGTVYAKGQWLYERMHYDPRPIDVAILGDSRALIGLEPDRIAAGLAAAGKPAEVVNMALVGEGRNIQWILARELMRTKRPKVLVLAINTQASPWGHDSFRYYAPAADVRREARYGLYDLRKNLMYLPFRQLKLFAASLAPEAFGLRATFDPKTYDPRQDNWTTPRTSADGKFHDPTRRVSRDVLMRQFNSGLSVKVRQSKFPAPIRKVTDADDRVYTDMIAAEAGRHGVKLLFVYVPGFHQHGEVRAQNYYLSKGQVLRNDDIAERDDLYMEVNHTNIFGAQLVSDRATAAIARLLP